MTTAAVPDYYVVAQCVAQQGSHYATQLSPIQMTLDQAREAANDGNRGGVILAVYPDGHIVAVEARAYTGPRRRGRVVATYDTVFEAGSKFHG